MSAVGALASVVASLPGGGEPRDGQVAMARAIESAIAQRRHLVVEAGTGTGKSLAYLVPALTSGRKVVVATATKALQDQLTDKDLPLLARAMDRDVTYVSLKGRSNYLCAQRVQEAAAELEQLTIDGLGGPVRDEVRKLVDWAEVTVTGDRANLSFEPHHAAWAEVSVSARECPGAAKCPSGGRCFTELARSRAAEADVVVVNMHLYGVHLSSGGVVLPEHDVVVFDEAHQLEDVISDTAGFELSPGTFHNLARVVSTLIADHKIVSDLDASASALVDALAPLRDQRLRTVDEVLAEVVNLGLARVQRVLSAARAIDNEDPEVAARKQRVQKAATTVAEELAALAQIRETDVAWVEGPPDAPRLRVAPLDVRGPLHPLWDLGTVVLTSATVPDRLPIRLGIPADKVAELDVGSPFDYESNALLYCATHLPDVRNPSYQAAMHDELAALITAAGGRTLALFTSWRAMNAAVEALRSRVAMPILAQGDLPKGRLVERFAQDEATCLFATMGFWQGVDLPGRTLSLVTIDRIPFPRPDEPLLQARRELAGPAAFGLVDLPRAITLLAQGTGRLIRTGTDRGVVAVLDPRLNTARYRWQVIKALPPMRRTRHRSEVEAFLHAAAAAPDPAPHRDGPEATGSTGSGPAAATRNPGSVIERQVVPRPKQPPAPSSGRRIASRGWR